MKDTSYRHTLTTNIPPQEALEKIKQVSQWWTTHFTGKAEELFDTFTIQFKNGDTYTIKISELIPHKKMVLDVIESYQGWHPNHSEWTGTKIVWEVVPTAKGSEITMTHEGLVSEFECFDKCNQAWNYLMESSLSQLLNEGKGLPV